MFDFARVGVTPARLRLQRKLAIGAASDPLEAEADRIAGAVMRGPEAAPAVATAAPPRLARKCACGGDAGDAEQCPNCRQASEGQLQRRAAGEVAHTTAPPIVHETLRSSGRPLDRPTRDLFAARFGHDFSHVQVHDDAVAARSAQAVNALAYTVGRHIVFAPGQYRPSSLQGRHLIAHELAHVLQQRSSAEPASNTRLPVQAPSSVNEIEARQISAAAIHGPVNMRTPAAQAAGAATLARANPDAVGKIMSLRTVVGAAIQFWPTNVTDTRIGPVTVGPGLLGASASRLNVIIGQNLTPRILARELLPLWTTATPFTPSGGGAPVPPGALTEEQLAQALLVYNQNYLPVPAMIEWRPGLRFPLPVEIEEATGIATVNPDVIRSLAGTFNLLWTAALDQRAVATAAPAPAVLHADVAAFLAAEPSALGRGVGLAARAMTNARAALPFITEAFSQLGAGGFDVALAFMDNLVNRDLALLAAQRDGTGLLIEVQARLVPPAGITPTQQASLTRANTMFGLIAGAAAAAPSAPMPTRAERTVTIDTVKLNGSTLDPATCVAVANAIYAQCNVRFAHGINATANAAQTTGWLGANQRIAVSTSCGSVTAEERHLFQGAAAAFGLSARMRAFFVSDVTGRANINAYSLPPYCATGAAARFVNTVVVQNTADTGTLAHELGHILLNSGAHPARTMMTAAAPTPTEITDPQCATIYRNA